jgi:hypothetical protein
LAAEAKGEIFAFALPDGVSADNFTFAAKNASNTEVGKYATFTKVVDSNGLVHVKVGMDYSKMSGTEKSNFVKAVKEGKNTFKVTMTRKRDVDSTGSFKVYVNKTKGEQTYKFNPGSTVDLDGEVWDQGRPTTYKLDADDKEAITFFKETVNFSYTSNKTYYVGGYYDNGKIREVYDPDMLLVKGNVYAVIDKTVNDTLAEVELLKQDKNEANQIKNNDTLRGKKLYLNTVWAGGVEYKVGKLGSQALKEAKMKKVFLKNCSKVGKGALRKCKQLRTVNLKDKNKVRKIHAKAFYDCKNLKTIIIDARKLNTVGKESFTKIKKNAVIKLKANKSKYNDVVKKIKKANKKANKLKYARLAP